MGNDLARLEDSLKDVLKTNGTPLKAKTARAFLKEVEEIASWFIEEGLLNVPQWESLGEDLKRCPSTSPGTLAVWSLVKVCLQSPREPLQRAVLQGGKVLEQMKGESRKGSSRDSESESESSEGMSERELQELGKIEASNKKGESPGLQTDLETVRQQLEEKKAELQKALGELRVQGEAMAQLKAGADAAVVAQWELKTEVTPRLHSSPTAPPQEWPPPYRPSCAKTCYCSGCTAENWREVLGPGKGFSPVLEDQNQQRYHQPLDFKLVKQLKEAVSAYGPQAAFTVSLVESLGTLYLTPEDWANLTRAVLSGGQYLEWKIQNQDNCQDTARRNAAAGNPQWSLEMLTGTGPYLGAHVQSTYPPAVYQQVATAALKAWKTLRGAGDLQGQLSKVLQGPTEPYADFVDRLIQTAGRMFGDVDTAMPLIKQLAYENANKWCREAIRPWRSKDLSAYIKVCRDITGPIIQGQVLAAAFAQAMYGQEGVRPKGCFQCGQEGHVKRNCPQRGTQAGKAYPKVPPGGLKPQRCPRCRKGNHWAHECRSMEDTEGNPLPPNNWGNSKNGRQGPTPRGPNQMYGVAMSLPTKPRWVFPPSDQGSKSTQGPGEPQQVPPDLTSVPPPEWS